MKGTLAVHHVKLFLEVWRSQKSFIETWRWMTEDSSLNSRFWWNRKKNFINEKVLIHHKQSSIKNLATVDPLEKEFLLTISCLEQIFRLICGQPQCIKFHFFYVLILRICYFLKSTTKTNFRFLFSKEIQQ